MLCLLSTLFCSPFPVFPLVDNDSYDVPLLLNDGDDDDVHRLEPIRMLIATRVTEVDEDDDDDSEDDMPPLGDTRNVPVGWQRFARMAHWIQRNRMVMERLQGI